MKIQLRPYQQQAINELRAAFNASHKSVILCAPTGAGKTIMFSSIVAQTVANNKKVLIVTDRKELLTQSDGALSLFGINSEALTPKTKKVPTNKVVVAMVETLARRIKKEEYLTWFKSLDLIIFDEAHKQNFDKLFEYKSERTYVIGATATPYRDGNQTELKKYYSKIINPIDIPYLIDSGFLANPISYGVSIDLSNVKTKAGEYDANQVANLLEQNKVYNGVIKNYKRICEGKKTLVFSGTIKSSKRILDSFLKSGYNAKHLDSEMPKEQRDGIINWYKETPGAILCNVGILTTGFDAPSTEVVILYRATKSMPLFLQMCGRGSRVTEGKDSFYILDFGNNIKRFGFWEKDGREWSLEKKKKNGGSAPVKNCPCCDALLYASAKICNYCDHEFIPSKKEAEQVELIELTKEYQDEPKWKILKDAERANLDQLVKMTKAKLIKPFWALHKCFKSYNEALQYTRALGYKDGFLYHQTKTGNFKNLIQ